MDPATNDAPPASPATTIQLEGARRRLITAHGQRVSLELAPTSVAIARTGAFALIGCTDGSIRLCAMGSKLPPANLGQLVSRGMNNTLLVTVAITEDCRTAFAGAQKGATEVLAWTFGAFPANASPLQIVSTTIQESQSEAKLRGFVSCSRKGADDYRLLCGRGIKSAHVWKVCRATPGAALDWSLLYELPTQSCGSLVTGGFLDAACAVWAKAEQGTIRLWRIDGDDKPHEDLRHARTALGVVAVASTEGGVCGAPSVCSRNIVTVGGATLIEVAAPDGSMRAPLAPPPKPGAGRRCAPRTVASVGCGVGSAAVAFADGAVAWYDGDSHRLLEVDATSGAPAHVACVAVPLGGALVGACHWDVKNREGWVSFFVPEKIERAATAEEVSASALWPAFVEAPPKPQKRKSSTKVTPRGAKQSMPSPGVPVVTTQRKRPREQNPQTPVEVAFDASSDDESVEHPLNAAAPLRVPYEALPPPGHALRLVTASARRANVQPPTWHYASRDERERATLERLRQLPPGNEDVVDATLGRLRLERQVAEALAAIGMQQP
ncbi:unnamed protein product [Pelagomonas calceolata]|uniref:Uncharacterized protein n=2 Tax=Pelagomonas calceolata TaxID=35677 RepID=A0A8J2WPQ0_9STRA|nr:unnamed protein product [Pelagomonas calceolata]